MATQTAPTASPRNPAAPSGGFFGQPRGLATLFFTEMWERFSYYGMRALLVLFMTAAAAGANPGMGFEISRATAIYGMYTASVYLMSLPGGWIADNMWGQRRAVFVGGCIIAAGHFSMAIPNQITFFLGLGLIILGTGLLKPNVSTMVGDLYPEGGARRDAGFSIFYMGINLGAFVGPLLCGLFGEQYNWHYGFSLAGIGMAAGLIQYKMGDKYLGQAGILVGKAAAEAREKAAAFYKVLAGLVLAVALFAVLVATGAIVLTLQQIARGLGYGIIIMAILYFAYLLTAGGHDSVEKKRLVVIFWLFILAALFWSGFEQAGSSLNLFAERMTNRTIFGWEAPASWLQSINPIFIIIFAPDLRLGLDFAVEPQRQSVDPAEVRARSAGSCGRLFRAGLGGRQCVRHAPGLAGLARCHLLPAHGGRAVPLAGRTLIDHQAGAAQSRGTDDGRVVHWRVSRQSLRRTGRGPAGITRTQRTVLECRDVRGGHRRHCPGRQPGSQATHGGCALNGGH